MLVVLVQPLKVALLVRLEGHPLAILSLRHVPLHIAQLVRRISAGASILHEHASLRLPCWPGQAIPMLPSLCLTASRGGCHG